MEWSAPVLGFGVLASIVSSALSASYGSNSIGSVSNEHRIDATPRRQAFSIWGLIYLLLICNVIYTINNPLDARSTISLVIAELLTAVWVPLFIANTTWSLAAAAVVLVMAAASSVLSVVYIGPFRMKPWTDAIFLHTAVALFAGWLCCAALLGTAISLKTAFGVNLPKWSLFSVLLVSLGLAMVSKNPVIVAPCVWALAWSL